MTQHSIKSVPLTQQWTPRRPLYTHSRCWNPKSSLVVEVVQVVAEVVEVVALVEVAEVVEVVAEVVELEVKVEVVDEVEVDEVEEEGHT